MSTTSIGKALALSLLLGSAGLAASQEPPRFFACGEVRFFGPACAPPSAAEAPPPAPPVAPEPLFTPETVGPEPPPLLLKLLLEPTPENAKTFFEWQYARQRRIQEVQGLIRELSRKNQQP